MRTTLTLSMIIMLFTAVSAVLAGDTRTEVYKFKFDGDNGAVNVELNSETMGFSLRDLQAGDSRTTVTEDGTSVTIARLAETYSLAVGAQVFEIPASHVSGPMMEAHEDHRVAIAHGMSEGLTIISKEPLDETRRDTIRSALAAAGIVDDIEFLSPDLAMSGEFAVEKHIEDNGAGARRVVIKKRMITD